MHQPTRFWLLLLFLFGNQCLLAQQISSQDFVITQFGMESGLPQSSVNDIAQTKDGYLWLATFGGLVRFDGVAFTVFDRSNTPGMQSDRILDIYESRDGALWLSTEEGLVRFVDGEARTFELSGRLITSEPVSLGEAADSTFWLTAFGRPYRQTDQGFVQAPVMDDPSLIPAAIADTQSIWLYSDGAIWKSFGDSVLQIDYLTELKAYDIVDVIEYPSGSGTLFLASAKQGLIKYQEGSLTHYRSGVGLPSNFTYSFSIDRSNRLWAVTFKGLSYWSGKRFNHFDLAQSPDNIQFTTVFEDNEGNYWAGTAGEGFFRIRPSIISTIGEDQGLENERMLSLTTLSNGKKLFATNCGGVYEWDGYRATPSAINEHLFNLCIWSVFEDSEGQIWFGSKVLYRSSSLNSKGAVIGEAEGFDGENIFAIMEDSEGTIWIGCQNGLYKYDGSSYHKYSEQDGLSFKNVRTLYEDGEGKLWVGTSQGLNIIDRGTVTQLPLTKGNSEATAASRPYVRAIYEQTDGTLWVGTYGNGIYRLKNDAIFNITEQHGLYDNIVSHLVSDNRGNFWIGTNRGIFRVAIDELHAVADGNTDDLVSHSYGTADGMHSAETNGGFQPSAVQDEDGTIYFPTVSGVAQVATHKVRENARPPHVYIENARTGTQPLSLDSVITLPHDNTYLEIKYTALNFRKPENVAFRYRLNNLNGSWIDVDNQRTALFTAIPPGDYTFTVTASNEDGVWNPEGASLNISVTPPFWQTAWFYALSVLCMGGFIFGGYFYRINKLKRENERQKSFLQQLIDSQEQERRRIASELHDGLAQEILVIKNRADLAVKQKEIPKITREQLVLIEESASQSIADVRNISHALRPVHLEKFGLTEALENLCTNLEQTTDMEWMYNIEDVDGKLPESKEINFYRIIQEGITNILKHAQATEASLFITLGEGKIHAKIWDNGIGFDDTGMEQMKGLGFQGIHERSQAMGGTHTFSSRPGNGTQLTITIPLANHE